MEAVVSTGEPPSVRRKAAAMTLPRASILATLGEGGVGSVSRLSIVGVCLMPSAGVGE